MNLAANKGIHWEWRAFGRLLPEQRLDIENFCSEFIKEKKVTDQYLWRPDTTANIKIRKKKLKFKRFLRATGDGFEQWDEGEHLTFNFPLGPSAIDLLQCHLAAKAPPILESGCEDKGLLKDSLSLFDPPVRLIIIRKRRFRYIFLHSGIPFQLEISEVSSPTVVTSVCLESNHFADDNLSQGLKKMRAARDSLALPASFRTMGYVQFLQEIT